MIEKIFSWFRSNTEKEHTIGFGRYTDSFKSDKQVDFWNKSLIAFESKNYLESYDHFFNYLLDEEEENVKTTKQNGQIEFEIYQGSKVVKGLASKEKLIAEVNVASYDKLNVAVMRKLLEMNYSLRYSRYAIQDGVICLKFDTSTLDGSPEKLYYALKEVAIRSDKQDDLLLTEFPTLTSIDDAHIEKLNESELEIKFEFLQKWINQTLKKINLLDRQRFEGSISYLLLNLAYKIDYLLTPHGKLMDEIEKIHRTFFTNFELSKAERNNKMIQTFENILRWKKDKIFDELYKVKATFGITTPTAHKAVVQLLSEELKSIEWYKKNNQTDMALEHLEYIAQYALFNYGLRIPSRLLMGLIIEVLNADFMEALNFSNLPYDTTANKLNSNIIQKRIKNIQNQAIEKYPSFSFNISKLKFDSNLNFVESMFQELKNINYESTT